MKRIKNIKLFSRGTKIVRLYGDSIYYYEYLMEHPHNDQYVLLLDTLTQEAVKIYIPNIEESPNWQTDYTDFDLLNYKYNYHLEKAERIMQQIQEGGIKDSGLATEIQSLSERFPEVSFAKLSRIAIHIANWQRKETVAEVRSILNRVAFNNSALDVNGDICEQPFITLDEEFRVLKDN